MSCFENSVGPDQQAPFQTFSSVCTPKNNLFFSWPKHILWILKRTVSDGSFEHPKYMLSMMGKKIFTILLSKNCLNLFLR